MVTFGNIIVATKALQNLSHISGVFVEQQHTLIFGDPPIWTTL